MLLLLVVRRRDRRGPVAAAAAARGRLVRRLPARLRAPERHAAPGPVPGRGRLAAVHARRVPHQDVRQPLHHRHGAEPGAARRAGQLRVRRRRQQDALLVRAVPPRRVGRARVGKWSAVAARVRGTGPARSTALAILCRNTGVSRHRDAMNVASGISPRVNNLVCH